MPGESYGSQLNITSYAMAYRSICKRAWIQENPKGTENEFSKHWNMLSATGGDKVSTSADLLTPWLNSMDRCFSSK